jgi:hypothetical protein
MGRSREGRIGIGCREVFYITADKKSVSYAFYFWRLQLLVLTFSSLSSFPWRSSGRQRDDRSAPCKLAEAARKDSHQR